MATHRDHAQLERRRRKASGMFERKVPVPEVARKLGVASQVVYRCRQAWQHGGEQALASKGPAGPKSRLTQAQMDELASALLKGPIAQGYKTQLRTLPRVTSLIKDLTGVHYHPGHVWRILGSLGFSCQRPERRAIERDEEASPCGGSTTRQAIAGHWATLVGTKLLTFNWGVAKVQTCLLRLQLNSILLHSRRVECLG